jgi:hypothetical protein
LGTGAYVASARASGDPVPAGTGRVEGEGLVSNTRVDALDLSGPPVSDGELLIHAAYEAARRMVVMETTGTTTATVPPAIVSNTRVDAIDLSGPPVSDGELLIHAAYEAARRTVEMETTGTTTVTVPPAIAQP